MPIFQRLNQVFLFIIYHTLPGIWSKHPPPETRTYFLLDFLQKDQQDRLIEFSRFILKVTVNTPKSFCLGWYWLQRTCFCWPNICIFMSAENAFLTLLSYPFFSTSHPKAIFHFLPRNIYSCVSVNFIPDTLKLNFDRKLGMNSKISSSEF